MTTKAKKTEAPAEKPEMTLAEKRLLDEIRARLVRIAGDMRRMADGAERQAAGPSPEEGVGYFDDAVASLRRELAVLEPLVTVARAIP